MMNNSAQGNSRFETNRGRNAAAKELLKALFKSEVESDLPALASEESELLGVLIRPLIQDAPEASQAAEGALTILALSLAEHAILDLRQRLPGDRSLGDWLCRDLLQPKNIPSTQGPFQSSSFRGGYTSDQVRSPALRRFVLWYSNSERTFQQIETFSAYLVNEFLKQSTELPPLPEIAARHLTFLNFALFHNQLRASGSGGAFEQYLLAGLLEQELSSAGNGHRIQTKNVGANDSATRAGGDIEVRHGQTLLKAYEVTANGWDTKLAQLDSSARAGLQEVTIVANGVAATSPEALNDGLGAKAQKIGMDVSVIDLGNLLDFLSSRITPHARAEAIVYVYRCLTRWHRRQPGLIAWLIDVLRKLDLLASDSFVPTNSRADIAHSMGHVSVLLRDLGTINEPEIPNALRKLAHDLEADSSTA